jgi:hypothetical protein
VAMRCATSCCWCAAFVAFEGVTANVDSQPPPKGTIFNRLGMADAWVRLSSHPA